MGSIWLQPRSAKVEEGIKYDDSDQMAPLVWEKKSLASVLLFLILTEEDVETHQLTAVCGIQYKLPFQVHHRGYLWSWHGHMPFGRGSIMMTRHANESQGVLSHQ